MEVASCQASLYAIRIEIATSCLFFLMIRRPPRSTQSRSSAASDVYKRQMHGSRLKPCVLRIEGYRHPADNSRFPPEFEAMLVLSLIHISEPTRLLSTSYAVFCLKKKKYTTRLKIIVSDGARGNQSQSCVYNH